MMSNQNSLKHLKACIRHIKAQKHLYATFTKINSINYVFIYLSIMLYTKD